MRAIRAGVGLTFRSMVDISNAPDTQPRPSAGGVLRDWLERPVGRRLRRMKRLAGSPREWILRRAAARQAPPAALKIDPQRGFCPVAPGELPGTEELVEGCRGLLESARPHLDRLGMLVQGKSRLALELSSDDWLEREPLLLDFALQDEVCLPVVEYLGSVPFLARVGVALSTGTGDSTSPLSFQRLHVDNDDFKHVKLVICAQDVGPDDGPLCFLPADVSARVLRALRRERRSGDRYFTFTDEEVFRHCEPSELVVLSGPVGTGAYVDLSRCLHFGSRLEPGRERLVYGLVFVPYHRLQENATSQIDPSRARTPLQEMLLRTPTTHPRGTFYPDHLGPLLAGAEDAEAPDDDA